MGWTLLRTSAVGHSDEHWRDQASSSTETNGTGSDMTSTRTPPGRKLTFSGLASFVGGLTWIVVFYASAGELSIPKIGYWNLLIGFVLLLLGFGLLVGAAIVSLVRPQTVVASGE
jgi:hypothetical protein